MVETAVPDGVASCGCAAGDIGASTICGVSSAVSAGGDIEWDGDEGLFARAVFCAAVGGAVGSGRADIAGSGCQAI